MATKKKVSKKKTISKKTTAKKALKKSLSVKKKSSKKKVSKKSIAKKKATKKTIKKKSIKKTTAKKAVKKTIPKQTLKESSFVEANEDSNTIANDLPENTESPSTANIASFKEEIVQAEKPNGEQLKKGIVIALGVLIFAILIAIFVFPKKNKTDDLNNSNKISESTKNDNKSLENKPASKEDQKENKTALDESKWKLVKSYAANKKNGKQELICDDADINKSCVKISYSKNKKILLKEYFNNKKYDGTTIAYYAGGSQKVLSPFKANKRDGNYTRFTKKGVITLDCKYKEGKLIKKLKGKDKCPSGLKNFILKK